VAASVLVIADLWLVPQIQDRVLVPLVVAAALTAGMVVVVGARRPRPFPVFAAFVASAVMSAAIGSWTGANSSRVTWFGSLISAGSRQSPRVAITFDDGPNAGTTLALRDILDGRGVKGTFFEVGRAVHARTDITASLIADGHLVANHSYTHDSLHWLDPRYTELQETQRTFADRAGVCPAFFRPPHGQHTPAMAFVVHRQSMVMIGWDVSVGDWATHNPELIARRVLTKVRRGSIIDLHDGLDGRVDADRTVLVTALPLILDGLAAKGLQPVRLDELLGRPGYLDRCERRRDERSRTRQAATGIMTASMAASTKRVRER
jgi:peptidoglycan/xylan/chitin deacetylase (PgdA/CDA1 family)